MSETFECYFEPLVPVAPVLGAHTGPSLVGMAVGLRDVLSKIP
jgi:hypothetical protein